MPAGGLAVFTLSVTLAGSLSAAVGKAGYPVITVAAVPVEQAGMLVGGSASLPLALAMLGLVVMPLPTSGRRRAILATVFVVLLAASAVGCGGGGGGGAAAPSPAVQSSTEVLSELVSITSHNARVIVGGVPAALGKVTRR
ncbi:MAG: hypothetical protein WA005_01800 [Candidatus Binataceae bacterium]